MQGYRLAGEYSKSERMEIGMPPDYRWSRELHHELEMELEGELLFNYNENSRLAYLGIIVESRWVDKGRPYLFPEIDVSKLKFDVKLSEISVLGGTMAIVLPQETVLFARFHQVLILVRRGGPGEHWVTNVPNDASLDEFPTNFTKDERKEQYEIFNNCAKLCAYMQAFPDHVKEGAPKHIKVRHQHKIYSMKCITATYGVHPVAHYRSGHFRTLRHERYRRDANGMARIVFVKAAMIGKAKTIKE